ncbi:2Fe-2S iron-sulfur cluster-binding protein [Paenibacillus qinlingensis]|uniref:Carbon-monoxide dehydrogenase small subunit n=1 Tax=Paenibacillus qinlingensis TaxID=1837343 RepID=A0ABU1NT79_9BACL|nr:2Fe-2S iron-sulfur cluster-binding protein [Paenibacillus qinlingensis]MDR6550691.1 carbon-monoxide dehydrogenase small subunit [Paenibacillus qinlingensis]
MQARGSGKREVELTVNGKRHQLTIRSADTLLRVLRESLGLTGAKAGCENGDCGACTVLVNGTPIKSCFMLAVEAPGSKVTTIEGLGGETAVQQAFIETFAFQCGFCTSGFIMVCHALLQSKPDADEDEIRGWLQSNLCRCTSYEEIQRAVQVAKAGLEQRGEQRV